MCTKGWCSVVDPIHEQMTDATQGINMGNTAFMPRLGPHSAPMYSHEQYGAGCTHWFLPWHYSVGLIPIWAPIGPDVCSKGAMNKMGHDVPTGAPHGGGSGVAISWDLRWGMMLRFRLATPGTLQGYRGLPLGTVPAGNPRYPWRVPGVAV